MFNPFNVSFQPYFLIQAPSVTGPSFIFQQSPSFVFPQIFLQNAFQNGISFEENAISQAQLTPEANLRSNLEENRVPEASNLPIVVKGNIIKEKIIKKPANRPATYVTERKYYLAQTLQEESNQNRKLRPRNLKKRTQKASDKSLSLIQNSLKVKEIVELPREDNGSSQSFQTCQKKKIEDGNENVFENSMKIMDLSTSKEDSK